MPSINVLDLSEEVIRALKLRAADHSVSTEAELHCNLGNGVGPEGRMGDALAAIGRELGGVELDVFRGKNPICPASFE